MAKQWTISKTTKFELHQFLFILHFPFLFLPFFISCLPSTLPCSIIFVPSFDRDNDTNTPTPNGVAQKL